MPPSIHTHLGPDNGGNFEFGWNNDFLSAHFLSDIGRKREHNEDSCVLCAPENQTFADDFGYVFAVADGMGGASAGEFASRLSLTTLSDDYYSSSARSLPEKLKGAIEAANARIFHEAELEPAYSGMGTTMSALTIAGDSAYIGQVGDSRVYVERAGLFMQMTEDHSLVAEQVRSGIITEEEAQTHSLKNLITRAVGIRDAVEIDLFCLKLQKGDTLLVCSDGLCNMVGDDEIAASLRLDSLQAAARLLVGKALEEGGSDNITVALVRINEAPPKTHLQEGCEIISPGMKRGIMGRIRKFLS